MTRQEQLQRVGRGKETEMEAELDVRSWLVASTEHPGPSKRMRQMEMEFKMVGVVRDPKVAVSNKVKVCPTLKQTDEMTTPNQK